MSDFRKCYFIKIIGYNFYHNLKWKDHIYYVCNLIRKLFKKLKIKKKKFKYTSIKTIYFALAQSVITYEIYVSGCAFKSHLNLHNNTINILLRKIFGKPSLEIIKLLYSRFVVDNANAIFIRNILFYTFYNNFECIRFNHKYSTKDKIKSNLKSIFCSTNFGQQSPIIMDLRIFKQYLKSM